MQAGVADGTIFTTFPALGGAGAVVAAEGARIAVGIAGAAGILLRLAAIEAAIEAGVTGTAV